MENLEGDLGEFEDILQEVKEDYVFQDPEAHLIETSGKVDHAQSVVQQIENEYKNLPDISVERAKERKELEAKLKSLQKQLKSTKNVKNHRNVKANTERANMRKKLKEKIERVKDDLYRLEREEEGAAVTPSQLVDEMLAKKDSCPV